MAQTAAGALGNQLGQLLFGRPDSGQAFAQGQAAGAAVTDRLSSARASRAKAMIDEDQYSKRQSYDPTALIDPNASLEQRAEAIRIGALANLGSNLNSGLDAYSKGRSQQRLDAADEAFRLGDIARANQSIAVAAGKPLETTSIDNGQVYDKYAAPDQAVALTSLGQAVVGDKNASAMQHRAGAAKAQAEITPAAIREFGAYSRLSPAEQAMFDKFKGHGQGTTVYDPSTGQPLVQIGGGGAGQLTNANKTAVQKDLMAAQDQLAQLRGAGEQMQDDYLTVSGRGKAMVGGLADKAGLGGVPGLGSAVQFNANRSKALLGVEQFFNQYRKEITGAAAAEQELKALKKASLDGSLGPVEFKARYDGLINMMEQGMQRDRQRLGLPAGGAGPASPAAPGSSGVDDLLNKYGA